MTSAAIARAVVTHLAAAGVRDVVLAPGSRSAPFVYALDAAQQAGLLRLHVRVDERGAGFLALGLARAGMLTGQVRPVAVLTTSGTAVANLHPAALEASHSGVPLVLLTADRPHELRSTGANQATIQPGIFAAALRGELDMPADFHPGAVRGHIARLLAAALGTITRDPGPVHLNVALREPLVPEEPWLPGALPAPVTVLGSGQASDGAAAPAAGARTLVVAGDGAGHAAAEVARAAHWPLLAEPTSGARQRGAIVHYQALLAAGLGAAAERVLMFGHPTLSRPVSALLARRDLEVVVVSPTARWTDVAGVAALICPAVVPPPPTPVDAAWLRLWQRADRELEAAFRPTPAAVVARALWGADIPLVLGSSNTVRAFDRYAPPGPTLAVANRGLAGIDGTIATATGLALGLGRPVRAVLGDLTFAHDAGSLARGTHEAEVDLQVVVLNDHGGGIFSTLEYGAEATTPEGSRFFERYFATPQELDLAALAAGFGARHRRVDAGDLAAALTQPVAGRSVLEVSLKRQHLRAERDAETMRAARVVEGLLSELPDNTQPAPTQMRLTVRGSRRSQ